MVIKSEGSLELTLNALGVNTRRGYFDRNKITWHRQLARPMEIRTAKNRRVYASVGYDVEVSWFMWIKKTRIVNKSQIIGMTVSRSKGKKGGWYISLHNQKAVLSEKHRKFVFCNHWTHYWASDQMLSAGLWASMDKKSKADKIIHNVVGDVRRATEMIKHWENPRIEEEDQEDIEPY